VLVGLRPGLEFDPKRPDATGRFQAV
jgi:hypothetical protein